MSCTAQLWDLSPFPGICFPRSNLFGEGSEMDVMQAKAMELERQLRMSSLQRFEMESDLQEAVGEMASLRAECRAHKDALAGLRIECQAYEQRLDRLQAVAKAQEEDIKVLMDLYGSTNLSAMRAELEELRSARRREQEVEALKAELEQLRKEKLERDEQDRLAVEVWGPATRSQPDATWDPAPVLLTDEPLDRPLTIGGMAAELGLKCDVREIHDLGLHVWEVFTRENGRMPTPRIFYLKDGQGERVSCFTERDRGLLTRAIRAYCRASGLDLRVKEVD